MPSRPAALSAISLKKTKGWLAQKPHVQSIDEYLTQAMSTELRRKEMQHKRWTERVADPLQRSIQLYVDGQSDEELNKRKRNLQEQYLNYFNKTGTAFMSDYDPSEYDPFTNRRSKQYGRVFTPLLRDPLHQWYEEQTEEKKIILLCQTGRIFSAKEIREMKLPQVPLGRQTMNGLEWLKTPFGYIESETRQKSRRRVRGSCNQGTLDLKAWTDTKCPPDLCTRELMTFHKRKFPERISPTLPGYSKLRGPDQAANITV
ncbi:protein FAM228B isoform X2 [Pseudophryne corroboree]|uniref:protein FAM228B isoform X2 n=1 Tax=Pseudophryne corroboree TaxID=495146 RepID=UPI003082028A